MAFNLGQATGIITLDASGVNRAVQGAQRSFDSLLGNIGGNVQRLGQRMQGIGMQTSLAFLPVTAFVAGGIRAFANFDAVLTEIEARTGATAEQMELVRATALQLGQDSAFSATQASDAMLQLLSSGYDLEQTFTALPDVLNLAAAGTLNLGYAADSVTDILAQFSLGAEYARVVSDSLARAAGASSATVNDLVMGFANIGPMAANFGMSVEQTAAALATFSEFGIKGSEAGTQLRSMLNNMTRDTADVVGMWDELSVSMYDAQGNMRELDDIIDDLNIAMAGMNDEERNRVIRTLGGSYGQMGLSALLAADGIDQMEAAMANSADAETVAEAQMSSFRGVVNMLKSSLETLSINVLGPMVDAYLKPLIEWVTQGVNKFNAWIGANPRLASTLGLVLGVLAVLGPMMMYGGKILSMFGLSITYILSPIGLLTAAIAGLYIAFESNFLGIRDFFQPFLDVVGDIWRVITSVMSGSGKAVSDITNLFHPFTDAIKGGSKAIDDIEEALHPFTDAIKDGSKWVQDLLKPAESLAGKIDALRVGFSNTVNEVVKFKTGLKGIADSIVDTVAAVGTSFAGIGAQATIIPSRILVGITQALENLIPLVGLLMANMGRWLFDNMIAPAIAALDAYIASGQAEADLRFFGGWLLKVLKAGWELQAAVGGWLFDNLVHPAVVALADYIGSGSATADLGTFGGWLLNLHKVAWEALPDIGAWLFDNLIAPAIADLATYISGQDGPDLRQVPGWILRGIKAAWEGLEALSDWTVKTFLEPLVTAFNTATQSGAIAGNFNQVGIWIRQGLEAAITAVMEGGIWVVRAILDPIRNALHGGGGIQGAIQDGLQGGDIAVDAMGMQGIGLDISTWILDQIVAGFQFLFIDANKWAWENILDPILQGLLFPDHDFSAGAMNIADLILQEFIDAINNLSDQFRTGVINPIANALMQAPFYLAAAASTFTNWLETTITAAYNRIKNLAQTHIVDPLNSALASVQNAASSISGGIIPNAAGGGNPAAAIGNALWDLTPGGAAIEAIGAITDWLGGQSGIPWTGSGALNQPRGIFHAQEAVVPHDGLPLVYPSPRGLMLGGDIGQLLMSMLGGASAQAPALAGAAPGGAGDTYNINVPISVDPRMLAEPGMMERARQFGQEAGDSAMDAIMKRRRSRGG